MKKISSIKTIPLKPLKNNFYLYIAVILVGIFSYIFSYYSVRKYLSLNAYGYDLGVQVQIYASTLHNEFFYSTLINQSYLSQHFSPFVFVIFIFYYLFPSPETLLIIQAVTISLAAIPLFLISRELLLRSNASNNVSGIISLIIATSYLISPYVESPITFDFHVMIFLSLFLFLSSYFFLKGMWVLDGIFIGLIVSLHSEYAVVAIFVIMIQYFFLHRFPYHLYQLKGLKKILLQRSTLVSLLSIIMLVLYFLMIPLVKESISRNTASGHIASIVTVDLPAGGVVGLLHDIIFNPNVFIAFLTYQFHLKEVYFLNAFADTGFLAFLSPFSLLPAIPYIAVASFSKYTSYYQIGWQYTAMIIPVIYLSTVLTIFKLYTYVKKIHKKNIEVKVKKIVTIILIFILLFSMVFEFTSSPIAPLSIYHKEGVMDDLNTFHTSNGSKIAFAFEKKIRNSDPYLLTINNLFPVYAYDYNAYMTIDNTSHLEYLIKNYRFEYIVNQPRSVQANEGNPTLNELTGNSTYMSHYGLYMASYGQSSVLVYKLNYTSQPTCIIG